MHKYLIRFYSYDFQKETRADAVNMHRDLEVNQNMPISEHNVDDYIQDVKYHSKAIQHNRIVFAEVFECTKVDFES